MLTNIEVFEVGGAVRDGLLGIDSKDVDFVVVAKSFDLLRSTLVRAGFKIFQDKPEFGTIRARVPSDHPLAKRTAVADFVMARNDGPSSDGRRPDFVTPGTLLDDLARRDFTVNAMALDKDGKLIDPHGGLSDLRNGVLKFVGNPMERIEEDGLRVLRAWRFSITKGLKAESATSAALRSDTAFRMLKMVSAERMREELEKMFKFDTLGTIALLGSIGRMNSAIFRDGLRLAASLKA
jgi:tRNA nucleotidyltransferase/poly(A) polymerase